jgi:hypothetical protein
MTHLDVSSNNLGQEVSSDGWEHLQTIEGKLVWVQNRDPSTEQAEAPAGCGQLGVIALANAIKDMGAMLSVNLLKNDIGVEQARALVIILKEHPTLKSLCGNNGGETQQQDEQHDGGRQGCYHARRCKGELMSGLWM